MLPVHNLSASTTVQKLSKRREILLFVGLFICMFSLTPLLVLAGESIGLALVIGVIAALAAALLIIRWPIVGLYIVCGCAVLIEQDTLPTPIGTDHLYIFSWPPALEGSIERPIGFLFIFIVVVCLCHYLDKRRGPLQGGTLLLPLLFFLLCVAMGVVNGLTSGGSIKIIVIEIRPFWYMFLSYLVAYNLTQLKSHVRTFFWIVIVAAGVKAMQGLYIYLIVFHGSLSSTHAIMSHEESFFFISLLLLVFIFWIHHRYQPQFYAALAISPIVIIALIANQRRVDYIAFFVGLCVAWVLVFWVKPRARRALLTGMVVCVVLGAMYFAIAPQLTGILAQPAHAVESVFQPSATDTQSADSNQYRNIENFDLKYTAMLNPLFGWGFGKEFLEPQHLQDISSLDPNYLYIPHDSIYWVWMRLGDIGFFALWYLFGSIIIRGCLIARKLRDPYLQLVAIYIVAATFMEILVAYADYQLFAFRNVIYLGLLAGVLMRLPALDKKVMMDESTRSIA